MRDVLLAELARTSAAVSATAARSQKVAMLAAALRAAAPDEVPVVVAYLSGELRQRRTGVGWASLRAAPTPAPVPTLSAREVDAAFQRMAALAGAGSGAERRRQLAELFGRATEEEQRFLGALVGGELRQGALAAVMVDAVAQAAGVPAVDVRRAVMLRGELAPVAAAVLGKGAGALADFRLQVGRPVQPMLAQPAESVAAALERTGPAAVEWKVDGVRVQVHRDGDEVAVFTRTLDDITARVPEIVETARQLPVRAVVLDAESISLRADGRPRPFQETASRVASRSDVARLRAAAPLTTYVFDLLHLDGEDLLGRGGQERYAVAAGVLPERLRVPRLVTTSADEASAFLAATLARGHEGVMVKALHAPYEAGRRGAGWLKVKPVHTLDLVVLAAEWGHGRRRGWLSNLHLGAFDPAAGAFVMLGKTFKGLTDAMLREQTARLLDLEVSRNEWQVFVRPALVVEVAFDGVQASPRYPAGVALRFARVVRYRPDKRPQDADTIDAVRAIHGSAPYAS